MSWADDVLQLLARSAAGAAPARIASIHLPRAPEAEALRGEFCALVLDDGAIGLAYVLLGDTLAKLQHADLAAFHGADALSLARELHSADVVRRTLAFAAVNALTRSRFDRAGFVPPKSADSLGGLDPRPGETVGMIGFFKPLVGRIAARGAKLLVIELREDLVHDDGTLRITTDPAELSACREVLATGTLMLNDSLDRMLGFCRNAERVSLIGPSVGGPPDPLFARGVTLLGGHWVHDAGGFVDALARGLPTGPFAFKSALTRADYPGWDALPARG